jgi:hypothetical protein
MSKLTPIKDYIDAHAEGNQAAFADSLLTYKGKKVGRQDLRNWRLAVAPLYVVDGKLVRLVAEIIK